MLSVCLTLLLLRFLFLIKIFWLSLSVFCWHCLSLGSISPLSAAAAAAAAAGRVALSGHSVAAAVLLASNLNDEVSLSHPAHPYTFSLSLSFTHSHTHARTFLPAISVLSHVFSQASSRVWFYTSSVFSHHLPRIILFLSLEDLL